MSRIFPERWKLSYKNVIFNSGLKFSSSNYKDSSSSSNASDNEAGAQKKPNSTPVLDSVESIRQILADKLGFYKNLDSKDKSTGVLETVDFDGVVKHWKAGGFKKIITMVGAGISTSAGIPDFRSADTGLYNNLQKYKLPYPMAIFEVDYFLNNPKPFFALAKELYPGTFKPTPCHYFIKLLHEKGLLVRHYTQNIDTLERIAGIPDNKIVEAHGTFHTNHCMGCKTEYSMEWMKKKIFEDVIPNCNECNSLVKPDIVFFGENLPDKFYKLPNNDFRQCDLLIIMGTSLEVQPFASLIDRVNDSCVRLLINREAVGNSANDFQSLLFGQGLRFDAPGNTRDVVWLGDCDDGIKCLANKLELEDELDCLINAEYEKIDNLNKKEDESFTSDQ